MKNARFDVFLAHNSEDSKAVEALATRLKKKGIQPWLDKWNLVPGEPWQATIESALLASRTCVLLVGRSGAESKWHDLFEKRRSHGHFPIIPVLLPGAEVGVVPTFLTAITYVDFRGSLTDEKALNSLIRAIGGKVSVSQTPAKPEDQKTQWTLVLEGSVEKFDQSRAKAVLDELRAMSGDSSLTIKKIESGSIIIRLDGEDEGYRVLSALYKAGKITNIFGLKIQAVVKEETISSNLPVEHNGIDVVFSYSHRDEKLRSKLDKHLSALKRNGVIRTWHDLMMRAGVEFETEIASHFDRAELILLLVSANFLASDYCYSKEMKRAMERHEAGEARVIPIIVSPVDWHSTPFGKLLALPTDGKPITMWTKRDAGFFNVAVGIRAAVNDLLSKR
jgi:hypothetical protein